MELREFLRPFRKWWWLLLAAPLLTGGISLLVGSNRPDQFEAAATLLIGNSIDTPNPNGNEVILARQLAQTYANIARQEVVEGAVMAQLGLTTLPNYTVASIPDTLLIEIRVISTNPDLSAAAANAFANQLIERSPTNTQDDEERQGFIASQLDLLESSLAEVQGEIAAKRSELLTLGDSFAIEQAEAELSQLTEQEGVLQANYAALLVNSREGAANTLRIITPASAPTSAIPPNTVLIALLAAVLTLIIAAATAHLLEYLDDSVTSPDEVKRLTDLTTLTGLPDTGEEVQLPMLETPRTPAAESFRVLRTGIQFATLDDKQRVLLVSSASPNEGKSTVSANLAIALAQQGQRVLLIDGDLRKPRQHDLFGLSSVQGLTTLLLNWPQSTSDATLIIDEMAIPTRQERLYLLPSGGRPPNPSELLGSQRMKEAIELFTTRFDFVVIDSPPLLAVTDPVVLSSVVSSVLLVIQAGRTRRQQLTQATALLRDSNAHIVGVVLNRLSKRTGDGYYYYYYEGYGDDGDGQSPIPAKTERPRVAALRQWLTQLFP